MKKLRLVWAGMAFVFAITFILHAQETATSVQSETVSGAAGSPSAFEVELQAFEMTTPMPATAAPIGGNFYTIQHPV